MAFHPSVLCATAFLHLCFSVISPRLLGAETHGNGRRQFRGHLRYLSLGHVVHSLLVGSLAVFSLLNFDSETLSESWVTHLTAEIALAYFSTDVVAILIIDGFEHKFELLHHLCGILGPLACLYWQGITIELTLIKLVSLLSNPLLFLRRYLLDEGKATTWCYLITFTAMILMFFICRISLIPLFWIRFIYAAQEQKEVTAPLILYEIGLAFTVDLLNCWWFILMVKIYYRFFPDVFNLHFI